MSTTGKNTEVAKPGDTIKLTNPKGFSYGCECLVIDIPDRLRDRPGTSKPAWQPDGQTWFIGKDGGNWWTIPENYVIVERASSLVVECDERGGLTDPDTDNRLSEARDDLLNNIFGE